MIYLELVVSFLQIGLFSIGGGYAAIPLIQNEVVVNHSWLSMGEFTDLITIAEMTPGPIAVNSATFVGTRIAGPLGAVAATLGCIFPSLVIVSLLFYLYSKYGQMDAMKNIMDTLRPAIIALIFSAGLSILAVAAFKSGVFDLHDVDYTGCALFVAALFAMRKLKLNPIWVMVFCGFANLAVYGVMEVLGI